jgi:hypothetical protein
MKSLRMGLLCVGLYTAGAFAADWDAAAAFGARENVRDLHLAPDGRSVAYLAPGSGQGDVLYTLSLQPGAKPLAALQVDGKGERIDQCDWVANDRLVCTLVGFVRTVDFASYQTRELAVDASGKNLRWLSDRTNPYSFGNVTYGGSVLERMPETASVTGLH